MVMPSPAEGIPLHAYRGTLRPAGGTSPAIQVNGAINKVRSRDGRWRIDPGFPTKVGGRHMAEPTSPARDSSLKDR